MHLGFLGSLKDHDTGRGLGRKRDVGRGKAKKYPDEGTGWLENRKGKLGKK
jgi:hypothetical protein